MSDSSIISTYMLSKFARDQGIKVLLSGAGGDELFGGYKRHFPTRIGSASWIAQSFFLRSFFIAILKLKRPDLAKRVQSPAIDFAVSISGVNLEFLNQALHDRTQFNDLINFYEKVFKKTNSISSFDRMLLDLQKYLPNNILSFFDKATMARQLRAEYLF